MHSSETKYYDDPYDTQVENNFQQNIRLDVAQSLRWYPGVNADDTQVLLEKLQRFNVVQSIKISEYGMFQFKPCRLSRRTLAETGYHLDKAANKEVKFKQTYFV